MPKKNLVVVCLDTFRFDLLNHLAPWPVSLPNLDAVRAESLQFIHAFGDGQPTIPIRRAYFTGERSFPWRFDYDTKGLWPSGRGWHKIPPEQKTLAEILLSEGYQTGLITDTYHMFKPTQNFTRGFLNYEFVRGYESDNFRGGKIRPDDLAPFVRDPDPAKHPILTQYLLNTRGRRKECDWSTPQVFSRASQWIRDHVEAPPFFLWIDSFGPHEPWDPPRQYAQPYFSNPSFTGVEFIYPLELTTNDKQFTKDEENRVRELYLGYLTFVDKWLGEFLKTLKEVGVDNDTTLMIVNDHGTELMDHGQFSKTPAHLYTHNTQLIWLIRDPDITPGVCDGFVQSHDLFPTALGLLGITHDPVAGKNALQWALEPRAPLRTHVITGWGSYAAVRDMRWNYFVNFEDPTQGECLYDLVSDPKEQENVAGEYPDEVKRLRGLLEQFLGQALPATLSDRIYPTEAPVRIYFGSSIDQNKRDAGFV